MPAREPRKMCYAAILDAGSSGTRIYMYGWKSWNNGDPSPPQIEEFFSVKTEPGIAKLIPDNEIIDLATREQEDIKTAVQDRVKSYLDSLFDHGHTFCAGAGIASTSVPLYFLATAGMRDLQGTAGRRTYYDALLACIRTSTAKENSKFDAKECKAITDEAEALYGWIAANYSLGAFSGYGMRASQTVGYVELGGASAQIAYNLVMNNATAVAKAAAVADKAAEQAQGHDIIRANAVKAARATLAKGDASGGLNDYAGRLVKVNIGALEFDMFLGSYRLGADVARNKFTQRLIDRTHGNTVNDPSRNKGCDETIGDKTFVGTAVYADVKNIVKEILDDDTILPADKLFNPPTDEIPNEHVIQSPNRSFVGGSSFWYNTREVFGLNKKGKPKTTPFSFDEYEKEIQLNFKLEWRFARTRREGVKAKFLKGSGFTAAWIQHILFECFKFKRGDTTVTHEDKLTFRPYNGSEGAELSWTLGRIVLSAVGDPKPQQMSGVHVRQLNGLQTRLRVKEDDLLRLEDSVHDKQHLFRSLLKNALESPEKYMEEQEKASKEIDKAKQIKEQIQTAEAEIADLEGQINTLKGTVNNAFAGLDNSKKFFL